MERAPQQAQIASRRCVVTMLASVLLVFSVLPVSSAPLQEPVYWDVAQQIREEIFTNTELMDNASWLTDVFGPRVAKSPGYKAAAEWAVEKFKEYGISNSYLEPYEFGIGYVNEYISVHMMKPQYMSLLAYPATWSQGTNGKVQGPAVYLDFSQIEGEIDLEPYRGRLENALVLTQPKQAISTTIPLLPEGFTEEELDAMAKITVGPPNPVQSERSANRSTLPRQQIIDFVFAEGAAAIVRTDGRTDYGTVVVENNRYTLETRPWEVGATPHPTELVMSAEHYNRIMRILEKGVPVEIEANVRVSFSRNDLTDHNVIAEIPGTDLAHELVIVGAHLEANPAATGAVDDAAGVVATMEAARTLAAIGVRPRRTIRFGLWGGHEMGLFGNRHHVRLGQVSLLYADLRHGLAGVILASGERIPEGLGNLRLLRREVAGRSGEQVQQFLREFQSSEPIGDVGGLVAQRLLPREPAGMFSHRGDRVSTCLECRLSTFDVGEGRLVSRSVFV